MDSFRGDFQPAVEEENKAENGMENRGQADSPPPRRKGNGNGDGKDKVAGDCGP